MAFVVDEVTRPTELYVARGDGSQEQRVTKFNDALLAEVDLVTPEQLTWKVKDGTTIEGWLMKPVGYTPGRKYPMVLKIHGGPHGAYGTGWFDTFQVLAGAGFFVLYPNPRGSTGYGHDFTYATRGKWVRAEPVAALYAQGRVAHAAGLSALEDEMCSFGVDGIAEGHSPDRVDALVWAVTELMLRDAPRVRGM